MQKWKTFQEAGVYPSQQNQTCHTVTSKDKVPHPIDGKILLNVSVDDVRLASLAVFITYFSDLFFSFSKDRIWETSAVCAV